MTKHQIKSKKRVADHGEVFTAEREVNAMLDLVKQETERIDSRFLEPACGDGNFLVEILRRKLAVVKSRYGKNASDYERYAVLAVTSIYGIDILPDNAKQSRKRMYKIFNNEYTANCKEANDETRKAVRYILRHNIICGNTLRMKKKMGNPLSLSNGRRKRRTPVLSNDVISNSNI
jgi:SAM-dependent methyltransferase